MSDDKDAPDKFFSRIEVANLTDAQIRRLAGARGGDFQDEGGWSPGFFNSDAEPDSVDDMAMVRSACMAIARLMDTVEEVASERSDLAFRLRRVIIGSSLNDLPGKDCAMPSVLDFLLVVAEETETSKSLAARLRAPLRKSVFGVKLDEESDYDTDEEG